MYIYTYIHIYIKLYLSSLFDIMYSIVWNVRDIVEAPAIDRKKTLQLIENISLAIDRKMIPCN